MLVSPELLGLPLVSELTQLLFQTSWRPPLPVSNHMMSQLAQDAAGCGALLGCFSTEQGMPALESKVSAALDVEVMGYDEPWSAHLVNNTVFRMLKALDGQLASELQLGLTVERNKQGGLGQWHDPCHEQAESSAARWSHTAP